MVRACHINSPRQELAINSDRKIHSPEKVKIGCDHHSENGFAVQPSNCVFEAAPVKSPKCDFTQSAHAAIGIAPICNREYGDKN